MLTLYLARHGETIWNTESRMQGQKDSPLTDLGISQATALARQMARFELDRIYTSPAPRAIRTAQFIQERQTRKVPILEEVLIHEMALGQLEGLTVDQATRLDPANLQSFFYNPDQFIPFENGESFQQVSERLCTIPQKSRSNAN